jgi:hypothetical protein
LEKEEGDRNEIEILFVFLTMQLFPSVAQNMPTNDDIEILYQRGIICVKFT